jgi:hypothetical protein
VETVGSLSFQLDELSGDVVIQHKVAELDFLRIICVFFCFVLWLDIM